MGLLMFLGMIGTMAYGGYSIKKETEATICDYQVKPSIDPKKNKENINRNFQMICKRSGIKMKNGNPINIQQCHKGIEYLQYQGFNDESVKYFKEIFANKYNQQIKNDKTYITKKHYELLNTLNNNTANKLIPFRREYYGNEDAETRMNKLLENPLWNKIIDTHTYIRGYGSAKYCEIWTLFVPSNMFKNDVLDREKNKLYKEICWIQGIDDGSF